MREWMQVVVWSMLLGACAEPTRSQLRAPAPLPQVLAQACNGLQVQLTLQGTRVSTLVSEVAITDSSGQLLADIVRVVLAFTSGGQDRSTITLVAQPTEAQRYVPVGTFTLRPGPWTVEVIVRRTTDSVVTCAFSLTL